jgi:hypothetical protein
MLIMKKMENKLKILTTMFVVTSLLLLSGVSLVGANKEETGSEIKIIPLFIFRANAATGETTDIFDVDFLNQQSTESQQDSTVDQGVLNDIVDCRTLNPTCHSQTCGSTCQNTCESTCQSTCLATCQTTCSPTCQGDTCRGVTCDTTCISTCPSTCSGQTCGSTCQRTCYSTCYRGCWIAEVSLSEVGHGPWGHPWHDGAVGFAIGCLLVDIIKEL